MVIELLESLENSRTFSSIDLIISKFDKDKIELDFSNLVKLINISANNPIIITDLSTRYSINSSTSNRRKFFYNKIDDLLSEREKLDKKTINNLNKLYNVAYVGLLKCNQQKDEIYLYHANSLKTSLAFISSKKLFSREYGERKKFSQTPQSSDKLDQKYKIYNDIFFDNSDIAARLLSVYGPITFVFKANYLLNSESEVKISKENPQHWENKKLYKQSDQYFTSLNELISRFENFSSFKFSNDFAHHTIFKNCSFIELTELNLEKILIENHKNVSAMNTFSSKNTSEQIKKRIKDTLENVGLSNIIVEVRKVKNKKKNQTVKYATNVEDLWSEN